MRDESSGDAFQVFEWTSMIPPLSDWEDTKIASLFFFLFFDNTIHDLLSNGSTT